MIRLVAAVLAAVAAIALAPAAHAQQPLAGEGENLEILANVDIGGATEMELAGDYAYVVNDKGLFIIDISTPASPKVAGHNEDLRAQLTSESSRVVMISGRASERTVSKPIGKTSRLQAARTTRGCLRRASSATWMARASASASTRERSPHSNKPFFKT